ncbi:MAG: hypothetical protein EXS17_07625 [Phycisphaerales bacterium]|nr:hypothetical protein [Phycisphaerales bacterium]
MNALEWIIIGSCGGAIGAWLRTVVRDECVGQGIASWQAILAVNLVGSALAGWGSTVVQTEWQRAFFLAGALGGFTTFSGLCVETVAQWQAGRRSTAAVITMSTMIGGPLAASAAAALSAFPPLAVTALIPSTTALRGRRMSHHGGGLFFIALGGALGSAMRLGSDAFTRANELAPTIPTATVNICGAALAGFVAQWLVASDRRGQPRHAALARLRLERFLLMGFAGGLTTMSAVSLEVSDAFKRSPGEALMIAAINITCGLMAAALGWLLARRLSMRYVGVERQP